VIFSGCFWPSPEGLNFPKQDIQAAAIGKSCPSEEESTPDPYGPPRATVTSHEFVISTTSPPISVQNFILLELQQSSKLYLVVQNFIMKDQPVRIGVG
jgi:hypothetical protein